MDDEAAYPAGRQQAAIKADATTTLALERTVVAREGTMLAWIRTATSLITFGFSIQQFFRATRQGADLIGPTTVGFAMIMIGFVALLLAAKEHRSAIHDLKLRYPVDAGFPDVHRSLARVLAVLIALLGLLALVVMLFRP